MTASAGVELFDVTHARRRRIYLHRPSVIAVIAWACIGLMVVLALFGQTFTNDPTRLSRDVLQTPSGSHWFGTDALGRDYFARVVRGARLSIGLSIATMLISTSAALVIGLISAFFKGVFDLLVQRIIDMLLAFPGLVLVMFMASLFGASARSLIVSLSLLLTPGLSRVVRASALTLMGEPYVDAARAIGASDTRIIIRHMLPNMVAPILVYSSTGLGVVILAEGALSFLGLGVSAPTPSWGQMLSESRNRLGQPWLSVFPGIAITIAVLGFNLLGDVLRDSLDPRLRRR
ncbi:MAG: ABC transporter permease [Dehalococcoidia bacterium]